MCLKFPGTGVSGDCIGDASLDDVSFEKHMNRLERNILRLRDEEDGVETHENTAGSKEEEGPICDVGKHDWRKLGDHKVEEPLGHESKSHDERTDVIRGAFGG